MTQTILNSMPIGVPGDTARSGNATVESHLQGATAVDRYGIPVVLSSGALAALGTGNVKADIIGFLVRAFPSLGGLTSNEDWGNSTPPVAPAVLSVLKRGYLFVKNLYGTPAKGGKVYARIAATSSTRLQGGIEAAAAATVAGGVITGTGTGTIAATVSDATKIKAGTYTLTLTATSQTAPVQVVDPDGIRLKDAAVGSAYSDQGLNFTITAGGTMTIGDSFSPVVTATTIEIPGAFFTGAVDADNTVEVAYNL